MACCDLIRTCHALRQIASTVAPVAQVRIVPVVPKVQERFSRLGINRAAGVELWCLANCDHPAAASVWTSFRDSPENPPGHPSPGGPLVRPG
jgi:hypothetical protein